MVGLHSWAEEGCCNTAAAAEAVDRRSVREEDGGGIERTRTHLVVTILLGRRLVAIARLRRRVTVVVRRTNAGWRRSVSRKIDQPTKKHRWFGTGTDEIEMNAYG